MPRYVPLSSLNTGAGSAPSANDFDWTDLFRYLRPAGTIANAAGYGDLGSVFGLGGGLFNFGSGIASGNPLQAASGAISAGNTTSGLLGGPTIGSAVTSAFPQLTAWVPGLAGSAALAPFLVMGMGALNAAQTGGGDLFDTWFGGFKPQAAKQIEEHAGYLREFPSLVAKRTAGADLFDEMDALTTPEQLEKALATATGGVRSTNLSPAYSHLVQAPHEGKSPFAADIPGMDMSWWEEIAPDLEGRNWASFIGLLDKGTNAGLDVGRIAGDRDRQMSTGQGHVYFDPTTGVNVDADPFGQNSQSAYDLSNAIAGIGGQLGIDWGSRGDERAGVNQGYTLADDQLSDYGFAQGQQGPAILNYLRNLDASVLDDPDFDAYAQALGTTRDAILAMPTFTPTPRNKAPNPLMMMGLDWGSTA